MKNTRLSLVWMVGSFCFIVYTLDCGVIIYDGDKVFYQWGIHRGGVLDDIKREFSVVGLHYLLFCNLEERKNPSS